VDSKSRIQTLNSSRSRALAGLRSLVLLTAICVVLVGQRPVSGQSSPRLATEMFSGSEDLPSLEYRLQDGYVHNWLVAGPWALSLGHSDHLAKGNTQGSAARQDCGQTSNITQLPAENASLILGDATLTWHYYRTLDDHFIDLSDSSGYGHLCAWAYAQVTLPSPQQATLILTTHGPADLWLNGQHVHRQEHSTFLDPRSVSFPGRFERGRNEILVRFERVPAQELTYAMALQIIGLVPPGDLAVRLPTTAENVARRQMFERLFEQAYLEREIDHWGNSIILRWAEDLEAHSAYTVQVQDWRTRTYATAFPVAEPLATVNAGHPARLWAGEYRVVLSPPLGEYYDRNLRYQKEYPIHVVDNVYSERPYGTYEERRREALQDAARRERGLYSEIAKLSLGRWAEFDTERLLAVAEQIDRDRSDTDMVGLLGLLHRYGDEARFDRAVEEALIKWALASTYWLDDENAIEHREPGARQNVLFYTSQILAGQLCPTCTFAAMDQTGDALRKAGERQMLSWLRQRATAELGEWDVDDSFEQYVVALSHLADLAENDEVRELAAVVLDRMFFTMALNSYKGIYGSAHGRRPTPMIKDGQLDPTSGIGRLMWGVGAYNHYIAGTVSLANSTYELPPAIAACATDYPEEMWIREYYTSGALRRRAWLAPKSEAEVVIYKTPDYMLSSAQDYRPGKRGQGEHIWQATLGHDAVVFGTHPANMSESDAYRNGFWRGNASLPRVAQWKDALIALYRLPQDDWMGFTHAYFPVYAFDETIIQDDAKGHPWAFARKGDGYLALTAAQGIELIRQGPSAYRELRSYGQDNVWLGLMGRTATDGSFQSFQNAVLALEVKFRGPAVRLGTLRGDTLSFGWNRPLRVNGRAQPTAGFEPYRLFQCIPGPSGDRLLAVRRRDACG
jgi:hypothetical protein